MLELSDLVRLVTPLVTHLRHLLACAAMGVMFCSTASAEQPKSSICDHTPVILKNSSFFGPPEPQWIYLSNQGSIKRLEYHQWGARTSKQMIIFVQGDVEIRKYQNAPECFAGLLQKTRFGLEEIANRLSVNLIFLARPGHYGSSGSLTDRRKRSTYLTMLQAINKITLKHRSKHVALVGHSGGAMAIAGAMLMGKLPSNCIVLASGAYSFAALVAHQRKTGISPSAAKDVEFARSEAAIIAALQAKRTDEFSRLNFDILPRVWGEKFVDDATIHLIHDPSDKMVPWSGLMAFQSALERNDYRVMLHTVAARDAQHHDTIGQAIGVAVRCRASEASAPD
jgi:hypothetical protein